MSESSADQQDMPSHGAKRANRTLAWAVALGSGLGLLATAVTALILLRNTGERLPTLTQTDYEQALAKWDAAGPADYDLEIDLKGNRPSRIHVQVRGGEPVHMTRDGVEPRQRRTWDYWTVMGMFDTIGSELEMAKDPIASFNSPGASQVVQWAEFDPRFGYPRRYRRVVLGANFEVDWTVISFTTTDLKEHFP